MSNVADKSEPGSLLNARWCGTVPDDAGPIDVAVVQEGLEYRPLAWHDGWQFVGPSFGIKIMSAWGAALDLRSMGQTETIDLRVEGAPDKVDEHVRRALCGVLDRLGADGATAFINSDSPEELSDAIFAFVREEEERITKERDALRVLKEAVETWGNAPSDTDATPDEEAIIRALRNCPATP